MLRRTRLLGIIAAVVAVSGCAAGGYGQRARLVAQETRSYCDSLMSDPNLDPIRGKIHMGIVDDIPMQILANASTPTSEESAAILIYASKVEDCRNHKEAAIASFDAEKFKKIEKFLKALRLANRRTLAALYASQITYGQYAQQVTENTNMLKEQAEQAAEADAEKGRQALRELARDLQDMSRRF
jgi:ABC-type molybdate transport system substrate-binding protein